jgi:hypothetical protein
LARRQRRAPGENARAGKLSDVIEILSEAGKFGIGSSGPGLVQAAWDRFGVLGWFNWGRFDWQKLPVWRGQLSRNCQQKKKTARTFELSVPGGQ